MLQLAGFLIVIGILFGVFKYIFSSKGSAPSKEK